MVISLPALSGLTSAFTGPFFFFSLSVASVVDAAFPPISHPSLFPPGSPFDVPTILFEHVPPPNLPDGTFLFLSAMVSLYFFFHMSSMIEKAGALVELGVEEFLGGLPG